MFVIAQLSFESVPVLLWLFFLFRLFFARCSSDDFNISAQNQAKAIKQNYQQ